MQSLHSVPSGLPEAAPNGCQHAAALAAARAQIATLESELVTARVTSTAVGVLMATFKIGMEAAYDMLVVAGENTEREVADIAQEVIDTGTLNWGRDMSGPRSSGPARRAAHM